LSVVYSLCALLSRLEVVPGIACLRRAGGRFAPRLAIAMDA
jgi:hypothetical protein